MDYYLSVNNLSEEDNYTARVVVNKTYTEGELIDKVLGKRNIVSKPDLEGVMSALKETFEDIVREGNGLNLPWLKMGYSMKGTFADSDTPRVPARNPLEITVNAGNQLTDLLPEVNLQRVTTPNFAPRIERFTDGASQSNNSTVTPGGIFEVTGERIRIDGNNSAVGLFFRNEAGAETKVDVLLRNEPGYISGQVPASLDGTSFEVVIRTQSSANKAYTLNEVRSGVSGFTLQV